MKSTIQGLAIRFIHTSKLALATAMILAATSGMALAQSKSSSKGGGVPELNPASMVSAVALMVGGALMLTDSFRRK